MIHLRGWPTSSGKIQKFAVVLFQPSSGLSDDGFVLSALAIYGSRSCG